MRSLTRPTKITDTDIYKNSAEKLNIPLEDVEECMNIVIDWTNDNLRDMTVPAIRWPQFITFEMRPHKLIDEEVKELYRKYIERDYGNYPREYLNTEAYERYEARRPIKRIRTFKGEAKGS